VRCPLLLPRHLQADIDLVALTNVSGLVRSRQRFAHRSHGGPKGQCELAHIAVALLRGGKCTRVKEMRKLLATIALLCLSSTVLAHDIYSNLRDRDGHLCCGGHDCMPVEATVLPDGNYYLPKTGEVIPADMASPSPDDRFHQCIYYPLAKPVDHWNEPVWESTPKTRCFFAPMNSS
jgi:hypothetical protein